MSIASPFKAYDIRGRIDKDLTPEFFVRLGMAVAAELQPGTVVLGRDARATSPIFAQALAEGLTRGGADVLVLGLCGTEEVYFATAHLNAGAGLMVTASHNPLDYNGVKMVLSGARPISRETGLAAIETLTLGPPLAPAAQAGTSAPVDVRRAYVDRVLSFVDPTALRGLRVLVNAGNGAAGPTLDALAAELAARGADIDITRMFHDPDPSFPNGIPNPLLPENHAATGAAVRAAGADIGVAWDGDFDRCFFFDAEGRFVDGVYVVGLLAEAFLKKVPGAHVVHDPRVVLNTRAIVAAGGGIAVAAKTGHTFMKAQMRAADAVYGGEMSAHHYFRDFMYCDSGMIPWLLVAELVATRGKGLAALVDDRIARYPVSGEINFVVADAPAAIARVLAAYGDAGAARDEMDGISLEFPDWRFNLRSSNTEPLLRLNVEARGDAGLVARNRDAIAALIADG